jgi:hypothetical protein
VPSTFKGFRLDMASGKSPEPRWRREGEIISRFFPAGRRARKTIRKLQDSDGLEVRGEAEIKVLQWTISKGGLVRIVMGQGLSLQLSTGSYLLNKERRWGSKRRRFMMLLSLSMLTRPLGLMDSMGNSFPTAGICKV